MKGLCCSAGSAPGQVAAPLVSQHSTYCTSRYDIPEQARFQTALHVYCSDQSCRRLHPSSITWRLGRCVERRNIGASHNGEAL